MHSLNVNHRSILCQFHVLLVGTVWTCRQERGCLQTRQAVTRLSWRQLACMVRRELRVSKRDWLQGCSQSQHAVYSSNTVNHHWMSYNVKMHLSSVTTSMSVVDGIHSCLKKLHCSRMSHRKGSSPDTLNGGLGDLKTSQDTNEKHTIIYHKTGKVLSYSLPGVGHKADPGVQAVNLRVTF